MESDESSVEETDEIDDMEVTEEDDDTRYMVYYANMNTNTIWSIVCDPCS